MKNLRARGLRRNDRDSHRRRCDDRPQPGERPPRIQPAGPHATTLPVRQIALDEIRRLHDAPTDLFRRPLRPYGFDQRRDAGNQRSRQARSGQTVDISGHARRRSHIMRIARPVREHLHRRCGDVGAVPPEIRVRRFLIERIRSAHTDHDILSPVDAHRIRRGIVDVDPVFRVPIVPRRRYHDDPRICRIPDRLVQNVVVHVTDETQIDDARAVAHGVPDRLDDVGDIAASIGIKHDERHQPHIPIDARDADAVIPPRADQRSDDRPMIPRVFHLDPLAHRTDIRRIRNEVPSMHVIRQSVPIIVDAVFRDLLPVCPNVVLQIRMGNIDAAVDHGDDHPLRSRGDRPSFRGVDLAQIPLTRPERIIRHDGRDGSGRLRGDHGCAQEQTRGSQKCERRADKKTGQKSADRTWTIQIKVVYIRCVMISTNLNLKRLILILGDFIVFEGALAVTLLIRYQELTLNSWNMHAWPFTILAALWIVGFYIAGLYDLGTVRESLKLFRTFLEGMIANLAVGFAFFYLIPIFGIAPRTNLFLYFTVSLVTGYAWRLIFNKTIVERFPRGRVLFIGTAEEATQVDELLKHSSLGLDLAYVLPVGELSRFDDVLKNERITAIVLGVRPEESPELRNALYRSIFTNVLLLDRAEIEEATTSRVPLSYVSETWFLHHLREPEKEWYETAKRVGDVLLAIPFGILTLLGMPFIALAIRLSSPGGPIFIRQTRVGKNGKPFTLIKYRTMKPLGTDKMGEPNGPQFTANAKTDPRIFPIGRLLRQLRIDELPQIWNVLRGDLSFIGPRPERPEFVAPLIERMPYYSLRHLTRPGLTGWAQVHFLTPTASLEDNLKKLQYDLYYIKHRSFLLDAAILLKTVGIVLRRQGT